MDESQNSKVKDWRTGWQRSGKKPDFLEFKEQKEHPIRELIVEKTAEVATAVLDVGCASCIDYPLFKAAGVSYSGRDITRKFLLRAKKLYLGIDARYGDVFKLRFGDERFPVVYCKDLLEHLPPGTYPKAVREMWRVTEKRMMIAFFFAPHEEPAVIDTLKNLHWNNTYNKREVLGILGGLPRVKKVTVIEHIGFNDAALYMVDKDEF